MRTWSNGIVVALAMTMAVTGISRADTIHGGPMSGSQETPPISPAGTGTATCTLNTSTNVLHIHIEYSGMTGAVTQSHIHRGGYGVNGGIAFNITPTASPIDADWTMTAAQADSLRNGLYYANLHTAANPTGETRGQLDWWFEANMDGSQEVPVVNPGARGETLLRFNSAGNRAVVVANVIQGLTGPVTQAHIHKALAGFNGAVQLTLTNPNPTSTTNWTGMTAVQKTALLAESLYVNFHTTANPGGECRGQFFQPAQTSVAPGVASVSSGLRIYPNPMTGSSTIQFSVRRDEPATLRIVDITGREVRQLSMGMARSGADNAFLWDGRDSRGSVVPAGVYYYVLQTSAGQASAKTIVLR